MSFYQQRGILFHGESGGRNKGAERSTSSWVLWHVVNIYSIDGWECPENLGPRQTNLKVDPSSSNEGKSSAWFLNLVSEWSGELLLLLLFFFFLFPLCFVQSWSPLRKEEGYQWERLILFFATPKQHHVTTNMVILVGLRIVSEFLCSTCVFCLWLHSLNWFKRKWSKNETVPRMAISIRKDLSCKHSWPSFNSWASSTGPCAAQRFWLGFMVAESQLAIYQPYNF